MKTIFQEAGTSCVALVSCCVVLVMLLGASQQRLDCVFPCLPLDGGTHRINFCVRWVSVVQYFLRVMIQSETVGVMQHLRKMAHHLSCPARYNWSVVAFTTL